MINKDSHIGIFESFMKELAQDGYNQALLDVKDKIDEVQAELNEQFPNERIGRNYLNILRAEINGLHPYD